MFTRKGILFLLLGPTIFLIYLYFFVGIQGLVEALQKTHPLYYSLAFASLLAGMTFYSLVWQHILGLLQIKSAFHKTFSFVWIASLVDLVIPAESFSGELSKVYLMSKNLGEDMGKVAASVVSHRILTTATALIGTITALTILFMEHQTSQPVFYPMLLVATITITSLSLMCYLSFRPKATIKITTWIVRFLSYISRGRWELTHLKTKLEKALTTFHRGIQLLIEKPKNLLVPFLYSVIAFLFDLSISFLVLFSLGFPVSLSVVLIVYTIVDVIQAIPLGLPGEIGITDVAMTTFYSLLGIPLGISASATILTRIITVWIRILGGYVAFQWMGITTLRGSGR